VTAVPVERGLISRADNVWVRFALRRTGQLLLSLWVLVTAAFAMIHVIPGDPVRAALGPAAPLALIQQRRAALGLDDPWWQQYLHYLGHLFTGDLGVSMTSGLPVSDVIADRLGSTVEMAVLAFAVAVVVSVPLGTLMAMLARDGRRRGGDWVFTSASIVVATIPEFLMAVGLVFVFSVSLHWLPVAGRSGPASYVLPVLSLAIGPALMLARIVRVEMLAVLETDYIRTARAKRVRATALYLRHALPNALTATLTLGGLTLGALVAGTVLVENIFAWPGIGQYAYQSAINLDVPAIAGVSLFIAVVYVSVNFVVDLLYGVIDPRIRVT